MNRAVTLTEDDQLVLAAALMSGSLAGWHERPAELVERLLPPELARMVLAFQFKSTTKESAL